MVGRDVIHQLGVSRQHLRHILDVIDAVDEVLIDFRVSAHHDVLERLTCRPALAVAKVDRVLAVGHFRRQLVADVPELVPCDVLVIRNRNPVLLEHMDIVEDNIRLVDANRHDVVLAVRRGQQVLDARQDTLVKLRVVPQLGQIQQHVRIEVRLNFLTGMRLECFRALARLLKHLDLHNHGTAGAARNGVRLRFHLAVRAFEFVDDGFNRILLAASRPPVVDVDCAFCRGILQHSGEINVIGAALLALGGKGTGRQRRNCQHTRQQQRTEFFQLHCLFLL